MRNGKPHLLILTPIGRYREPLNQESLERLAGSGLVEVSQLTVIGVSEVSRARNRLCYMAEQVLKGEAGESIDSVFWIDADMVYWPETVLLHHRILSQAQHKDRVAITGAYANRYDNRMSASPSLQRRENIQLEESLSLNSYKLEPVMSGMGCLMVLAQDFREHMSKLPRSDSANEIFACCPTIEKHRDEYLMVSEDFNYCRGLYSSVFTMTYLVRDLQYGHVASKVLVPMLEEQKT